MDTIKDVKIDVAFVCVPTPFGSDGKIDSSIVEKVEATKTKNCVIAIKSTVTPDIVTKLHKDNDRVVYNPEFLTEQNALDDFVNPPMHIFGGDQFYCKWLHTFYLDHSRCKDRTTRAYFHVTCRGIVCQVWNKFLFSIKSVMVQSIFRYL